MSTNSDEGKINEAYVESTADLTEGKSDDDIV